MARRTAAGSPAVRMSAEQVVAWRLARQHLAGVPAPDPAAVARALVGVQAQVLSSAALSIAIRSNGAVGATATALAERRLIRSWAMRGTLHLFAADDYPTIVAALRPNEPWRRPAWLRWFGVTEPQMEAAIEAVGEILDDGRPRTRAELAGELAARLGPHAGALMRSSWGSFLNLATNRGYLCHAAGDGGTVRFVRPRRWLGAWRDEDPRSALRVLVERYLASYGPASIAEITRWWGVANQRDIRPVIADLGAKLTLVEVDGEHGYIRAEDVGAIEAMPARRASLRLLGPFDPLIVGAGLRSHLLPAPHLKRVSRAAGWISPVVLVDGVVAGIWDHARVGDRLAVTVEAFRPLSRTERTALERVAAGIGAAHGATVTVGYGPVFASPTSQSTSAET